MIGAVNIEFDLGLYSDQLHELLPVTTIQKAEKYHFTDDRKRCLAGELLKRVLLADKLNTNASELKFETNRFGKPILAGKWGNGVHFNLSHSGKWVVIVTDDEAVGIDIEFIKSQIPDVEKMVYTDQEIHQIYASGPDKQLVRFFKQWTRKESYIKALGLGFYANLEKISILESPDGIIRIETDIADNDWLIRDLQLDPQYSLSICSKKKLSDEFEIFDIKNLIDTYH